MRISQRVEFVGNWKNRRSIGLSFKFLQNFFFPPNLANESFLRLIENSNFRVSLSKGQSSFFGECYRATLDNNRVYFQDSKIVFGNFDETLDTNIDEAVNLGRMLEKGVCDAEEKLQRVFPGTNEEMTLFCNSYYCNSVFDEAIHDWKFLEIPEVYQSLQKLSSAVIGVTFLTDCQGLILEYVFSREVSVPQLTKDVELGLKVFKSVQGHSTSKKE